MRGKLITFEGPEGSGKSTQSRLLCEYLEEKGISFLYVREPGGTEVGEKIRNILLDPESATGTPTNECLLFLAARAQLVETKLRPALEDGKVVVLDRFTDSTIAYQGYGSGLDIDFIKELNNFTTGEIKPDLTIYLDIESEEGLKRSSKNHPQDRMEAKGLDYHQRVRDGYRELAKAEPERIKLIPVRDEVNETQGLVREEVNKLLKIE